MKKNFVCNTSFITFESFFNKSFFNLCNSYSEKEFLKIRKVIYLYFKKCVFKGMEIRMKYEYKKCVFSTIKNLGSKQAGSCFLVY